MDTCMSGPHEDYKQWNDWHWQLSNVLTDLDALYAFLGAGEDREHDAVALSRYPMALTPYYASLINEPSFSDPVFSLAVPSVHEEQESVSAIEPDHLGEDAQMPVPGLIRRYRDRAVLLLTPCCPVYCRHCSRKRRVVRRERELDEEGLERIVEYLAEHAEISDVIVSGGEPLLLETDVLERVLKALRTVPSVTVLRIGSRAPVTLPMRVDGELVAMLQRYHPLYLNTQFNHPAELTPESRKACRMLADAGVVLGNQAVLLRGVNDDADVLEQLFRGLLEMRVRPYYLFQCEPVEGAEHFKTPIKAGVELMDELRRRLGGMGLPRFVADLPDGGKIPLESCCIVKKTAAGTLLRNPEGMLVEYPEA